MHGKAVLLKEFCRSPTPQTQWFLIFPVILNFRGFLRETVLQDFLSNISELPKDIRTRALILLRQFTGA